MAFAIFSLYICGNKCQDRGKKCPDRGKKCQDRGKKCQDRGKKCQDHGKKAGDRLEDKPTRITCEFTLGKNRRPTYGLAACIVYCVFVIDGLTVRQGVFELVRAF